MISKKEKTKRRKVQKVRLSTAISNQADPSFLKPIKVDLDKVEMAMRDVFKMSLEDIKNRDAREQVAMARHALIYCLNALYPTISITELLNRETSTIRASIGQCKDLIYFNLEYRAKVEKLAGLLA